MSISLFNETDDFKYDASTIDPKWGGRGVYKETPNSTSIRLAAIIGNSCAYMKNLTDKIKPRGGSYEVEVEKDSGGTTTVSGNISYETDTGVKIEAEVKVDSEGKSSGSVSVGGKF